jgi:1,2-dihydroxy-3-keto-5-methylthiopentene dioxygenase
MTTLDAARDTTVLRIFPEDAPDQLVLETSDGDSIARELGAIGVRFERWDAEQHLAPDADERAVLAAYRTSVERLQRECGYQSVDVIRLLRGNPNAGELRAKFLSEHTHGEDEVRFFVEGRGAFYLRVDGRVFQTICVRGDLISVPAGTRHWFDMGSDPAFCAIRLFTNSDGWIAQFSGDRIADRFPKLDG